MKMVVCVNAKMWNRATQEHGKNPGVGYGKNTGVNPGENPIDRVLISCFLYLRF